MAYEYTEFERRSLEADRDAARRRADRYRGTGDPNEAQANEGVRARDAWLNDPFAIVPGMTNPFAPKGDRAPQRSASTTPSPVPAPADSASLAGLQAAGGVKVPTSPPPVTSGAGDGGAAMTDSGIDRILGAQQGSASMAGLRQGMGMRQYPSHAFVLPGKRVY